MVTKEMGEDSGGQDLASSGASRQSSIQQPHGGQGATPDIQYTFTLHPKLRS